MLTYYEFWLGGVVLKNLQLLEITSMSRYTGLGISEHLINLTVFWYTHQGFLMKRGASSKSFIAWNTMIQRNIISISTESTLVFFSPLEVMVLSWPSSPITVNFPFWLRICKKSLYILVILHYNNNEMLVPVRLASPPWGHWAFLLTLVSFLRSGWFHI